MVLIKEESLPDTIESITFDAPYRSVYKIAYSLLHDVVAIRMKPQGMWFSVLRYINTFI